MDLLSNEHRTYECIRRDYPNEVDTLYRLINKPLNTYTDPNDVDIHVKFFDQIAPDYEFALGYKEGFFNDYQVIVYLYKRMNHHWVAIRYNMYPDRTCAESLTSMVDDLPIYRNVLSDDIFYIYHCINPRHLKLVYNTDDVRPNQKQIINSNLNKLELDPYVLNSIINRGSQYPSKFCMDLWMIWLYFAMISEYFPKNFYNNELVYTKTGKLVKAIGIVQCLYSYMSSKRIANFSKSAHNKYVRNYGAKYLCNLAKVYLKLWDFNLHNRNIIMMNTMDMIYHPKMLDDYLPK